MFSGLSALVIEDVEDVGDMIVVRARTRDEPAACPGCGEETSRVHGYHERTAADVPADGRSVVVKVRVRRMRCPVPGCPRQTFREQVPSVLERYQRRTARLAGQVGAAVRELAGRAGSRLLAALGIGISRHTALRALLAIRLPDLEVPRVLGIDDFALRRGLVYATILIDAETGRRVDVLEGRTADVVEDWLREHPGVEAVTRDGSGAYGEAVRSVQQLLREIRERGYPGSSNLLVRYLNQGRADAERPHVAPRKATQILLTRPDSLTDGQRETAARLSSACPEMKALASLISSFAAMLDPDPGNEEKLPQWMAGARAADLPHLHSFTRGLDLDIKAATAAVTLPHHNGRTEGVNNKTKMIKRQMFGRAGFGLLRHRILLG